MSALAAVPLAIGFGMFAFVSLGEGYFANGAIAAAGAPLVRAIVFVVVILGGALQTLFELVRLGTLRPRLRKKICRETYAPGDAVFHEGDPGKRYF